MTADVGTPGPPTTVMHEGELPIDEALVGRLLAAQLTELKPVAGAVGDHPRLRAALRMAR